MSYECHVTLDNDPCNHPEFELIGQEHGWSTSFIDGDPLLGQKCFFYFTCHDDSQDDIEDKMWKLADYLGEAGHQVLQLKIEQIIFDTKKNLVGNSRYARIPVAAQQ